MNERREWRKSEKEAFILRNLKNYVLTVRGYWGGAEKITPVFCWFSGGYDESGYRTGSLMPSEIGAEPSELTHLSWIEEEELTKEGFEEIRKKIIEKVLDERNNYQLGYRYYWDEKENKISPFAQYKDRRTKQFIDSFCLTLEQNERLEKVFKTRTYQQILNNLNNYTLYCPLPHSKKGTFLWFNRNYDNFKDLGDKYELIADEELPEGGYDEIREKITNNIIAEKENWGFEYSPFFSGYIWRYVKKNSYSIGGLQFYYRVEAFTKEQNTRLRKSLNIPSNVPLMGEDVSEIGEETTPCSSQFIPTDDQERKDDEKLTELLEKIQNPSDNVENLSNNLKAVEGINEKKSYQEQISIINSSKEKLFGLVGIKKYSELIIETINNKLVKFGVKIGELNKTEAKELAKLNDGKFTEKQEIDKIDNKISQSIGEISAKNFLNQLLSEVKAVLNKTKQEKEKVKDQLIKFSESDNNFWKSTYRARQAEVQQALGSLETSSSQDSPASTEPTNYWPWILGGVGIITVLGIVYLLVVKNRKEDKTIVY